MNYAIFCYREDHQCLGLCLEQIRSIDRAAQFYLFDDAAKPLFPAQVPRETIYPTKSPILRAGGI